MSYIPDIEEIHDRWHACRNAELDCYCPSTCDMRMALLCIWTDAWNEGYETCSNEEGEVDDDE